MPVVINIIFCKTLCTKFWDAGGISAAQHLIVMQESPLLSLVYGTTPCLEVFTPQVWNAVAHGLAAMILPVQPAD